MKQSTLDQYKPFAEDYNSGISSKQLIAKYKIKTDASYYNLVSQLRKQGLIPPAPFSAKLSEAMKNATNTDRSDAAKRAAVTRAENKKVASLPQYRSIYFPGGFTIQVEKESLNRIVLHKNGSVTVVQD